MLKNMHTVPFPRPSQPAITILKWGKVMFHVQGQGVCIVRLPEGLRTLTEDFIHTLLDNRKVKSGITMKASAQVNFEIHGRFLQSSLFYSAF